MPGAVEEQRHHWDGIYGSKEPSQVSWYQPVPRVSIELIEALEVGVGTPVIDVGGGASTLVEELLARKFADLTVLDISESALQAARNRLGVDARRIHWIRQDILGGWHPKRRYGLWHDRAVFHFFVNERDRKRYLEALGASLAPGGVAVVATFATDGPDHCSGLPVARYGADELALALGEEFEQLASRREEHRTPSGVMQPFTWVAFRRGKVRS